MSLENSNNKDANFIDSFKATILFSGVQIYQIAIRIIRSKFVAMLLGPVGMGITSLLHSTTDLVSASTNLGLKTSGVKSIAAARVADDKERLEKTMAVLRRLVLITGILGTVICAVLAPFWSQQSFGNSDYIWSFVAVSLVILFEQLNQGELALLQGLQQRRMLARANVIGQTIGLLMTIPLYYIWGVKAIVAVLVLSSLLTLCITYFYVRKLHVRRIHVSYRDVIIIGREMVKLGFLLSIQHLLSYGADYIVRNFVSRTGGLDQVGLYSAGTTIITMYLGLVFTAMATDYFPRLAATRSMDEMGNVVRSQTEITLLLFLPVIIAFVVFIKPIILFLYSDKFIPIEGMLYWAMSGTLIKAMAWALSYSILSKASAKVFFINEVIAVIYRFTFNIIGYKLWGLSGFGISILITYTIYFIQMSIVTKHFFNFHFGKHIWFLFIVLNILVILSLVCKMYLTTNLSLILGSILLVAASIFSLRELDKKMDLRKFFNKKVRGHE